MIAVQIVRPFVQLQQYTQDNRCYSLSLSLSLCVCLLNGSHIASLSSDRYRNSYLVGLHPKCLHSVALNCTACRFYHECKHYKIQ